MEFKSKWLFLFFLLLLVALCLIASFRFISVESTITLLVFSLLFASIIFQLDGSIGRKMVLLVVGNGIGLFWNFVFYYFSFAGSLVLGRTFDAVYTILYPLLNLMWVVPFWSFSLGMLPKAKSRQVGKDVDL